MRRDAGRRPKAADERRDRSTRGRRGSERRSLPWLESVKDPKHALTWLTAERDKIRRGATVAKEVPRFSSFAASLFQEKVNDKSISAASGRKKWGRILERHHRLSVTSTSHWDKPGMP